jgi:hypothetical protein
MANPTTRRQRQCRYEIAGINSMERKERPPGCGERPQNFLTLDFPLGVLELFFGFLAGSLATQKTANCISDI